ncbi:MAG: hypothetical protein HY646_12980 [Acidobacteria bacterium]|nr:hypothetical protein [Acidobacteriota bacterium]
MKSDHIDVRKLYNAVAEQTTLTESETEHLKTCDECLELIRVFVRQRIQASKGGTPEQSA